MTEIRIPAQLIDVAVTGQIKPGDKLLVVNGICIGLQTPERLQLIDSRLPINAHGGGRPRKDGKPHASQQEIDDERDAILRTLAPKPLLVSQLLDALGIERKDSGKRTLVNGHIRRMFQRGLIRKVREDRDKMFARYEVTPPTQKARTAA